MKFTLAVVVIALVAVSNASYIGWGGPAVDISGHGLLGHGLLGGHGWGVGHGLGLGHGLAVAHPAVVDVGHAGLWGGVHGVHGGPTLVQGHSVQSAHGVVHGGIYGGVHGAHVLPVAAHHGHHEASYVAANRGSVHVAPLAGHIASVSSVNQAPAPGTTW